MTSTAGWIMLGLALALGSGAASATDHLQDGLKLILKADPGAGKFKAAYVSKSPAPVLPSTSPLGVGATFQILSLTSCELGEFDLPASNWQTNAAGTLHKFVNKTAPDLTSEVKPSSSPAQC
jgi:hypothetical protein